MDQAKVEMLVLTEPETTSSNHFHYIHFSVEFTAMEWGEVWGGLISDTGDHTSVSKAV